MNPAALLAVDPPGLGGAVLRGPPGPARDSWLHHLRTALPEDAPLRRVPLHVGDERLLGGLDLAATLASGQPRHQAGLLAEAAGGLLLLAMAERIPPGTVARITAALDAGGLAAIALDEGVEPDEAAAAPLLDRLAFHLAPEEAAPDDPPSPTATLAARARLPAVAADEDVLEGLCLTAASLGIASLRAPILALRTARAAAALAGRNTVAPEDAALAARLVLAPRATAMPQPPPGPAETDPGQPESDNPESDNQQSDNHEPTNQEPAAQLADTLLAAATAAIPPGLLAQLRPTPPGATGPTGRPAPGRQSLRHPPRQPPRNPARHGRPAGVRPGDPSGPLRLNLIETLRAAAPWQRLRTRPGATAAIQLRREDFRVTRLQARRETTTIFLVDASGSHAAGRMAEAKGAVQLLLAECYVRRDQVAVLAFRNRGAELLLPPTRSLVRAKRSLAGLPGGGGTPLAAGIDAACALATAIRRRGGAPALVLLTDAQPNVGRDGKGGRPAARRDAEDAARRVRAEGHPAILVDTSPRPGPRPGPRPTGEGRHLAETMAARYVPLPHADGATLLQAIRPR